VLSNRIVIQYSNISAFKLLAFVDNSSTLNYAANFSFGGYNSQPKSSISPNLTKVSIYGNVLSSGVTSLLVNSFFIDYTLNIRSTIDFPIGCIIDPLFTLILMEDDWIYIRQIQNPANPIVNIDSNL